MVSLLLVVVTLPVFPLPLTLLASPPAATTLRAAASIFFAFAFRFFSSSSVPTNDWNFLPDLAKLARLDAY